MKEKKFKGAEVVERVRKVINKYGVTSYVRGIGNGDQFGIEVNFKDSELAMFLPFKETYYLKDLTEETLTKTIQEVKFYTDQITIKENENSKREDLSDI